MEEAGVLAFVGTLVCTAETYTYHTQIGYFHPIQSYYLGSISEPEQIPKETDHSLEWIDYNDLKGNMFSDMQNWALEMC